MWMSEYYATVLKGGMKLSVCIKKKENASIHNATRIYPLFYPNVLYSNMYLFI